MARFESGRDLLEALYDRLDDWVSAARVEAYGDLFEGPDAILTEEELQQLDSLDSQLSRESGQGLWGAEEYGIVAAGLVEEESTPHVVCTYYPQLPEYVTAWQAPVDDETRDRFNEALWNYFERVVDLVQADIEEFVWSSEVETWQE